MESFPPPSLKTESWRDNHTIIFNKLPLKGKQTRAKNEKVHKRDETRYRSGQGMSQKNAGLERGQHIKVTLLPLI
jgi:hypothetical protein